MQLFHTSPEAIIEVTSKGRFGGSLFFSANEYVMTAGNHVVYGLEIDESAIIEAGALFYHEDSEKLQTLVEQVMGMVGCDEDTAEELIAQREDVHSIDSDLDVEDLADASWDIQAIAGKAAILLGYRGVELEDEQGAAYLINMIGHESEMVMTEACA